MTINTVAYIATQIFSPIGCEVSNPNLVSMGWNQGVSMATPPPALKGKHLFPCFFQFPELHPLFSLTLTPSPIFKASSRESSHSLCFHLHITFTSSCSQVALCLPLIRIIRITFRYHTENSENPSSQNTEFSHIFQSSFCIINIHSFQKLGYRNLQESLSIL